MSLIPSAFATAAEHAPSTGHEAAAEHAGPHIPTLQWVGISDWVIPGTHIAITPTMLSTWLFMVALFIGVIIFNRSLTSGKCPKTRAVGIDLVQRIDVFFTELLGDAGIARKYLWLVAGFFVFIFFANIFGLILDIINLVVPAAHAYLRPINSDLNTTLVMGTTVVLVAQATGVMVKGFAKHYGHYLLNFTGENVAEKCINLFIGWLHFIGEFIRIGSLSLRLFLNIFVGAILIGVMVYIGSLLPGWGLGEFLSLPFWFFELLVAFLQAYIFMTLSGLYLKEAIQKEHH